MRRFEINNEKVNRIAKFACAFYCVYCVCYIVAGAITLTVLYKDQICKIFRRIGLKISCFFKKLQDKLRPKVSGEAKEALAEFIARAEREGRCKVMSLDDLDEFDSFDCSEE